MDEHKKKEGVSVKELEVLAKKHRFELFYVLLFIFATLFSLVFWGTVISVFAAGIGGILGALFPVRTHHFSEKICTFVFKQEKTIQIILAAVGLIVAIFLPPLVFLMLGIEGGKGMVHHCRGASSQSQK